MESIADTVGIIQHGKMLKEIRMQDIEEKNLNYIELTVANDKHVCLYFDGKIRRK